MENEAMNPEMQEQVSYESMQENTENWNDTASIEEKCADIQDRYRSTMERLMNDLKETNFNPYIRQTRTSKYEIFHSGDEETPFDTFEFTDVKQFSARSLLIAGAAAIALVSVGDAIFKKLLK